MPLLYVGVGIAIMLLLLIYFKFDAFFSLLITSVCVGLLNGMHIMGILDSMLTGIGGTMGKIILILTFGSMLGKLIEESGAAHTITHRLTDIFGTKYIQYALLITGFIVGLPMMYNASFLVLIPIIYTFASTTKIPMIYLGIPLSATLSIAHGYLPPHPGPTYVSLVYGANINTTLLIGLVPVIPACLIVGIWFSHFFNKIDAVPPKNLYHERSFAKNELPRIFPSLITTAMPVILMLLGAISDIILGPTPEKNELTKLHITVTDFYKKNLIDNGFNSTHSEILSIILTIIKFLSDANIALLMAVFTGIYFLGLRRGKKMKDIMDSLGKSVGSIATIILLIAAGGAFSQVLKDCGVNEYIKSIASGIDFNPLILAFGVASIIRLAVGSATVATMTTASIMLPIAQSTGIAPELMVLATGSGSLLFSHFNDIGFWMFKEYYNVTIKQTFAVWTVMESLVGFIGLAAALLLSLLY